MGADYSFEFISIETYAPQFIGHNKFFLGSVRKHAIISRGLYTFYPIFHCGVYCGAVYIAERLIFPDLLSIKK